MRDEIEARLWVEHGTAFNQGIANLLAMIRPALARLHEYEWAAPWAKKKPLG